VLAELSLLGLDWDRETDRDQGFVPSLHLPPVSGPDVKVSIGEWVRRGYSGPALVNCLARLGCSPKGKRALLTLDELAARFEVRRVSRRAVTFDRRDLDWFNRRWLVSLNGDEVAALLVPHWQAAYGRADRAEGTALSPQDWQQTLSLAIRGELVLPEEAVDRARFAFSDELALDAASVSVLEQSYAEPILRAFARELPQVTPFEFEPLDAFFRELRMRFKDALGVRSRDVMYVLRAALTGRQDGPCLVVACQLLGPARCSQRAGASVGHGRSEA
jgi:glutamyl/glutaminyl-tRNA synthetase